ncbi:hypothetical protein ACWIGI_29250 [Nocardia sp. NPDC055321]
MSKYSRWGAGAAALALAATGALSGCGNESDSNSSDARTSDRTTTTGAAAASPGSTAPRNPYLAADRYAITHLDSAQSDSFPDPIPRGTFTIDPAVMPRVPVGPVNIMTLASTDKDYRWISSTQGVRYVDVSDGGFRQVAGLDTPGSAPISEQALDQVLDQRFTDVEQIESAVQQDWKVDWTRIANGVYGMVDRDNRVYYNTFDSQLYIFGLRDKDKPEDGIEVVKHLDLKPFLGSGQTTLGMSENVVGVSMTYDGHVVVASSRGLLLFDRALENEPKQVRFSDDETISNSMANDEDGGIYVASDKFMHKVVWTGSELSTKESDGAWSAPYDFGEQPPAVKFGIGTGSTPTLMGFGEGEDELVVITDGANRMKLVAFWRNKIPDGFQKKAGTKSNRIADQIAVTAGLPEPLPEFVQSEQSVVVNGYGAFVVQNIGDGGSQDRLIDVLANGPVDAPPHGMQRFEWDPAADKWNSVWTRGDVVSTSMVPAVSSSAGVVFVNGYSAADGWEVTGLDWKTGETVHRTIFGQSNLGNGAYAIVEGLPNGDLLFNSIGGPFRAKIADE